MGEGGGFPPGGAPGQPRVSTLWLAACLLVGAGMAAAAAREPVGNAATLPADQQTVHLAPPVAPPASPALALERRPAAPAAPGSLPCAAEALQIDVVPTKATFAAGEMVRGMFFVQTSRATGCAIAMPTSFRIENVATGKVLGSTPAVTEVPSPLAAGGGMHTSTFAWEPQDCSGPTCEPVPAALYQAVAEWHGGSPYRGWGEFRIGA